MVVVSTPDGKEFSDAREYRRYLFEHYYSFRNRSDETLSKVPGEINGEEFQLDGLTDCVVTILDVTNRVVVSDLTNCKVFLGPSKESVMFRKCKNCVFTVACKDLRVNSCQDCTVNAFSTMPVQLDDSHHISVGNFNGAYSGLTAHFRAANLDPSQGTDVKVKDFSERDSELPQPHFTMLTADDEASQPWEVELENAEGPPENPINLTVEPAEPPACPHPVPDPHASFEEDTFGQEIDDQDAFGIDETNQPETAFGSDEEFEGDPFGEPASRVENQTVEPSNDFFAQDDQVQSQEEDQHFQANSDMDVMDDNFGMSEEEAQQQQQQDYGMLEQQQQQNFMMAEQQEYVAPEPQQQEYVAPEPQQQEYVAPEPQLQEYVAPEMQQQEYVAPEPQQQPQQYEAPDLDGYTEPMGAAMDAPSPPVSDFMADSDEQDARIAWEAQFAERVKALDQQAEDKQAEMQEKAEEELDEHYAQRTNENAVRYTTNRESENAMLQENEDISVSTDEDINWARVVSLVDVNTKEGDTKCDRMKALLMRLKN